MTAEGCVNANANDQDAFYAYNQLNRSETQTAGLGGIERRDYLTHPPVATKENEVYDKIIIKRGAM